MEAGNKNSSGHGSERDSQRKSRSSRRVSTFSRLKNLGPYRPQTHVGFTPGRKELSEFQTRMPVKKHWPAIFIVGAILVVFAIPLISVSASGNREISDLFDLVFFLFTLFWKVGWSVGVVTIALIFLGLLFSSEKLVIRKHEVILRMEWLGIGFGACYPQKFLGNLRTEGGSAENGSAWRGRHLVFDYLDVPVSFGSHLDGEKVMFLTQRLQQTLEGGIPVTSIARPLELPQSGSFEQNGRDGETVTNSLATSKAGSADDAGKSGFSSAHILILANLVPVFGVLYLGWQIGEVMLLFWIESAIIGLFNAFKMIVIGRWISLFMVPFFMAHYGGFMVGHLLFIFILFINKDGNDLAATAAAFVGLWPAILSLFISHGYSFLHNFIRRKEYAGKTLKDQMSEPYKRIIIMHVTIIFGGFLVMALDNTLAPLLMLISLKIVVDLFAHKREHAKKKAVPDERKSLLSEQYRG